MANKMWRDSCRPICDEIKETTTSGRLFTSYIVTKVPVNEKLLHHLGSSHQWNEKNNNNNKRFVNVSPPPQEEEEEDRVIGEECLVWKVLECDEICQRAAANNETGQNKVYSREFASSIKHAFLLASSYIPAQTPWCEKTREERSTRAVPHHQLQLFVVGWLIDSIPFLARCC